MERTVFSPYQIKVINLMSHIHSDEQMAEINDLLSHYFAQKAMDEIDKLWDEGKINEQTIEEWKHEHMRTKRIQRLCGIAKNITDEQIKADERLAYLLSK